MKSLTTFTLLLITSLLHNLPAAAGQIPVQVDVQIADGTGFLQSFLRSSTLVGESMTANWTVNDYSADFTMDGTCNAEPGIPYFILVWEETAGTLPLSVTITSGTAAAYAIFPVFTLAGESDPDLTMRQDNVTTSTYFGHYFPDCAEVYFGIELLQNAELYNLTVTMQWGTGVATEPRGWSQVKALYR